MAIDIKVTIVESIEDFSLRLRRVHNESVKRASNVSYNRRHETLDDFKSRSEIKHKDRLDAATTALSIPPADPNDLPAEGDVSYAPRTDTGRPLGPDHPFIQTLRQAKKALGRSRPDLLELTQQVIEAAMAGYNHVVDDLPQWPQDKLDEFENPAAFIRRVFAEGLSDGSFKRSMLSVKLGQAYASWIRPNRHPEDALWPEDGHKREHKANLDKMTPGQRLSRDRSLKARHQADHAARLRGNQP